MKEKTKQDQISIPIIEEVVEKGSETFIRRYDVEVEEISNPSEVEEENVSDGNDEEPNEPRS